MISMAGSRNRAGFGGSLRTFVSDLKSRPWVRERLLDIYFFRKSRIGMIGFVLLSVYVIVAIFANWIAPYPLDLLDPANKYLPPSFVHLFGTDSVGRDVLSEIIYGSRVTLPVGVIIVAIGGTFGTVIGLISGYLGGKVDMVFMRITDIFFSFPTLILAMAIAAALGPSLNNLLLAASVAYWPAFARLARGSALAQREKEYVEAARALGLGRFRIMFAYILPNILPPVMVYSTMNMGTAILLAAALSFIGLGAPPNVPEWGWMVSHGKDVLDTSWWVSIFPAIAIFGAAMAFMLIGGGLTDALDPRLRR
jgi:peptide/nickel transport system permease protein